MSVLMRRLSGFVGCVLLLVLTCGVVSAADTKKKRIFIVSSYNKAYIWSQSTQKGVSAAMLKLGYLDTEQQVKQLQRDDQVESRKAVIKKDWMDTKRKDSRAEMAISTSRIVAAIRAFGPDLVLLGDDNAAKHIGGQLLVLVAFQKFCLFFVCWAKLFNTHHKPSKTYTKTNLLT